MAYVSFGEGLSRVPSGFNAATTRNVISATMAHLIPCNDGSRFVFSHTFLDLLVGKMEATLEGQDINVRIRSNKLKNKIITWTDSLPMIIYINQLTMNWSKSVSTI